MRRNTMIWIAVLGAAFYFFHAQIMGMINSVAASLPSAPVVPATSATVADIPVVQPVKTPLS